MHMEASIEFVERDFHYGESILDEADFDSVFVR
jgi:hypothetical protein